MRTKERDFALLYFENGAQRAQSTGWTPNAAYRFSWYDPRTGEWQAAVTLTADGNGQMQLPPFPGNVDKSDTDWAAKIVAAPH